MSGAGCCNFAFAARAAHSASFPSHQALGEYPLGASFFGSGGYHHQLAGNTWNSLHAGRRPNGAAGLDRLEIIGCDASIIADAATRAESAGIEITISNGSRTLSDPWGTAVTLTS